MIPSLELDNELTDSNYLHFTRCRDANILSGVYSSKKAGNRMLVLQGKLDFSTTYLHKVTQIFLRVSVILCQ